MSDGRKPRKGMQLGGSHSPLTRERIRTGMILSRLERHLAGKLEMSATQVRAAEILLKKALPDLSAVEHTGAIEHRNVRELTDAELLAIAQGSSEGTVDQEGGEDDARGVHRLLDS